MKGFDILKAWLGIKDRGDKKILVTIKKSGREYHGKNFYKRRNRKRKLARIARRNNRRKP